MVIAVWCPQTAAAAPAITLPSQGLNYALNRSSTDACSSAFSAIPFKIRTSCSPTRSEFPMPSSQKRIRKAVFPVAGLGTRFLPATKAIPKEMLTVVDRPVIQHVVDEARSAGIEHFVFVTGRNKPSIEEHFDHQPELETTLSERGKTKELAELAKDLPQAGSTSFTRQQAPLG